MGNTFWATTHELFKICYPICQKNEPSQGKQSDTPKAPNRTLVPYAELHSDPVKYRHF